MFDGFAEKGFGRGYIALRTEHEVHCLAGPIRRPVEIDPLATNLQIGLVNTPRLSRRCCEAVPALFELGTCKTKLPPHQSTAHFPKMISLRLGERMRQRLASLDTRGNGLLDGGQRASGAVFRLNEVENFTILGKWITSRDTTARSAARS